MDEENLKNDTALVYHKIALLLGAILYPLWGFFQKMSYPPETIFNPVQHLYVSAIILFLLASSFIKKTEPYHEFFVVLSMILITNHDLYQMLFMPEHKMSNIMGIFTDAAAMGFLYLKVRYVLCYAAASIAGALNLSLRSDYSDEETGMLIMGLVTIFFVSVVIVSLRRRLQRTVLALQEDVHNKEKATAQAEIERQKLKTENEKLKTQTEKIEKQKAIAEAKKKHLESRTDDLTGLPNKKSYKEILAKLIEQNKRFGILFIDMDGFKSANDTFGHEKVDQLLISLGKIFKNQIRDDDHLFRWGGDEFVIIVQNADVAEKVAKRICARVCKTHPMHVGESQIPVGASIGVAIFPDHVSDFENPRDIEYRADKAMYLAKRSGKGIAVLYNPQEKLQGKTA